MTAKKKAPSTGPKEFASAIHTPDNESVNQIDYRTLRALRRDGGDGPLDHPCPLCGPTRSTEEKKALFVLRTWEPEPGFVTYFCAHCLAQGYARVSLDELLYPHRYADEPSTLIPMAAIHAVKPRTPSKSDLRFIERLWEGGTEKLPSKAVAHFRFRGIPIEAVPQGALRWHPQCPWLGMKLGCLIARYTDALTGTPLGLWRRVIDGRAHDPMKPKDLGRKKDCVIRLWPSVGSKLVIAEGVETALAAATRITHRGELLQPVWATGDAGNMRHLPVIPGIEHLIILADNDRSGTGEKAAAECARRWQEAGREVTVLMPTTIGHDFNDEVMP